MRTQGEIADRLRRKREEMMSFEVEPLAMALDWEHVKEFIEVHVPENEYPKPPTDEETLKIMQGYADFGWGKIQTHRGISASRTIDKMRAWVWLLGHEETLREFELKEETSFAQYGAPILRWVCETYGFPVPNDRETQRMTVGLPCVSGCDQGCGK